MAHSLSARKRVRQNLKRAASNREIRSRMRTLIKKFRQQIEEGKIEEAKQFFPEVAREIDLASKKKVIHDSTGSRYKSRLARLLNTTTSA